MPIYEYKCEACGGNYEQMRRMAEADTDLECPKCKSHEVNRALSSFATTSGSPDRAPARARRRLRDGRMRNRRLRLRQ